MAALHAENLTTDNVIYPDGEAKKKWSPAVPNQIPSGTKNAAEIFNTSNSLNGSLSLILHTPKEEQDHTRKTRRPHDEQHSLEEIAALVPSLTDSELKRRFPKAWNEHKTIKRKTSRTSSRDELHPGFDTFRDFLTYMGPAPGPTYTMDKIDPSNPVYGPEECQWADKKTQARNRSTNVHLTWMGERRTLAEWAELTGISYETLKKRHQRGKSLEEIFAGARFKKYLTPPDTAPTEKVTPPLNELAPVPSFDEAGWPVTLEVPRNFETGWQHARAQAIKAGGDPLSKNHFGAWVIGSHVKRLRKKITDAGLWELIGSGRDRLTPDEISYLEKLAAEQGIDMARYYRLALTNEAFLAAYRNDVERWAMRSLYAPHPRAAIVGAEQLLRNDIKTRPQYNPFDVWKIFSSNI